MGNNSWYSKKIWIGHNKHGTDSHFSRLVFVSTHRTLKRPDGAFVMEEMELMLLPLFSHILLVFLGLIERTEWMKQVWLLHHQNMKKKNWFDLNFSEREVPGAGNIVLINFCQCGSNDSNDSCTSGLCWLFNRPNRNKVQFWIYRAGCPRSDDEYYAKLIFPVWQLWHMTHALVLSVDFSTGNRNSDQGLQP